MALELTNENFEQEVLKSPVPVLVDFWASWCGPCQMMGPVVEELSAESNGKYKICKVNVDEQMQLASQYGIMSIPAFFVFKDGKIAQQLIGARPKQDLLQALI